MRHATVLKRERVSPTPSIPMLPTFPTTRDSQLNKQTGPSSRPDRARRPSTAKKKTLTSGAERRAWRPLWMEDTPRAIGASVTLLDMRRDSPGPRVKAVPHPVLQVALPWLAPIPSRRTVTTAKRRGCASVIELAVRGRYRSVQSSRQMGTGARCGFGFERGPRPVVRPDRERPVAPFPAAVTGVHFRANNEGIRTDVCAGAGFALLSGTRVQARKAKASHL
jgi:hypothetical protein